VSHDRFLVTELMSSIYEFIQRRADWKKIEKTVDKVSFRVLSYRLKLMSGNVRPVGQRGLCNHVDLHVGLCCIIAFMQYCTTRSYTYVLQFTNASHTKISPDFRSTRIIPVEPAFRGLLSIIVIPFTFHPLLIQ
jgi:hypothetical protein